MICPFASFKPVPNHGGALGPILGVVIHVTAGEGDPYNEFINPANQVSSHFGIGNGEGGMPDGDLEQYVDTTLASWAQMAGNGTYISVETEGEPTDPLTPAQIATFARLYAWLHEVHSVPFVITDTPGNVGFITHGDGGQAWGGHLDCPGPQRSAQRQQILNLASGSPAPAPTPTPAQEASMAITPTFPHGGQKNIVQAAAGSLWHKWFAADGWHNETLAGPEGGTAAGCAGNKVTVSDAQPGITLNADGSVDITFEGTDESAWNVAQASGSSEWIGGRLP